MAKQNKELFIENNLNNLMILNKISCVLQEENHLDKLSKINYLMEDIIRKLKPYQSKIIKERPEIEELFNLFLR